MLRRSQGKLLLDRDDPLDQGNHQHQYLVNPLLQHLLCQLLPLVNHLLQHLWSQLLPLVNHLMSQHLHLQSKWHLLHQL